MKITKLCITFLLIAIFPMASSCFATETILVLGDSLSASYGIKTDEGWVSLLNDKLKRDNFDYTIVNASVSGVTTNYGVKQIKKLLDKNRPQILILALGSNDGIRKRPIFAIRKNLLEIINHAKTAHAKVLLVGFQLPPSYGVDYVNSFEQIYSNISKKYNIPLVPFLLTGVAENRILFQTDNLHPTANAQPIILDNVWEYLQPMLTIK